MLLAFAIILIDLIGFAMVVPIMIFYATNLGASPTMATFLIGLYTIATFFTAPILGRLSDYHGRKPVLSISMLGATFGYLLLAFGTNLWIIALSRLISGAMAGNIATAQAY